MRIDHKTSNVQCTTIKEGDVIEGKITGVQPYGVFVRLTENCSGLIHASELDKLESSNPTRFFKVGQMIKVRVLRVKPGGTQAVLRVNQDNVVKKRTGAGNFETNNGFVALAESLLTWIEEAKEKEIF